MRQSADFDAFYQATNHRLLHQMYAMTANGADAQDCVQEAYARAWQSWDSVGKMNDPEGWVRTVAWRIAVNRWRKTRNGIVAYLRHGPDEPSAGPSPDNVALIEALRRISDEQRRAIVLHHLVGQTVDEIARETGTATGTVKARLARGRAALAVLLSDSDPTAAARKRV